MVLLPRNKAVIPVFILTCFIATAQRIAIGGIDFDLLRLMILTGWARVFWRGEFFTFRWKLIDVAMVTWCVLGSIAYITLHSDLLELNQMGTSTGTRSAFIYRAGITLDALGLYFLYRVLIRSWEDLDRLIMAVLVIAIPLSAAFVVESMTGRNLFAMFGGVPEMTKVRGGRLRCQGAFTHPIIAGVFFATILPMVVARYFNPRANRALIVAGGAAFMLIIFACFGTFMFLFRHYLGFFRWTLIFGACFLHLIMEKPVWHLIARINFLGGTGWHRYNLINQAILRWDEWFWLGTKGTAHWGWGLSDVTNQYVFEAVNGGIFQLGSFLWILALCFQGLGRMWRANADNLPRLAMSWALGVALFAHCMSFISVSYFGQAKVVWYLQLALVATFAPVPHLVFRRAYSPKLRTKQVDPYLVYQPSAK
ncbi:MAG: hypothetical protein AAF488_12600 [Planctomycetota bacterium]